VIPLPESVGLSQSMKMNTIFNISQPKSMYFISFTKSHVVFPLIFIQFLDLKFAIRLMIPISHPKSCPIRYQASLALMQIIPTRSPRTPILCSSPYLTLILLLLYEKYISNKLNKKVSFFHFFCFKTSC
jgi:hypothetical protein